MMPTQRHIDLFTEDPIEFVRIEDEDDHSVPSARMSALYLLEELCTFKSQVKQRSVYL